MFERRIISKLSKLLEKFPVVGIVGPRQVGKTTLVKGMKNKEAIYLDLESDIDRNKLLEPGIFFRNNQGKRIIIDEVQEMPHLFPLLRAIIDEDRRPGRFLLLGSAAPALMQKSSESLAGRVAYIELTPFLLTETEGAKEDLWLKGGFPESYLESDSAQSVEWRKQFIKSYVERDLPLLGLDANRRLIANFLRMIAHSNGNIWNATTISKSLGISSPTVKRYLDFLEGAFLVHVLEPYYTNVKKRITKSPKIYMTDTGILHALLDISTMNQLQGHPAIGHSWENFVILQIKGCFPDKFGYHFYRTHDGTEMDLVLTRSDQPIFSIEIKYSLAPKVTRGMLEAITDLGTKANFIVTPGKDRYFVHDSLEVIGLQEMIEVLGKVSE